MARLRKDITGKKYYRLTAIKDIGSNQQGRRIWLCKCECGNETTVDMSNWSGSKKSCGCLLSEGNAKKHGKRNSKIYQVWSAMKDRCLNENSQFYCHYGGRGITICEEWLDFENFYKDMGDVPDGMTLDRINNDGDYEPKNCRWATRAEQNKNKRQPKRNKLGQYVKT